MSVILALHRVIGGALLSGLPAPLGYVGTAAVAYRVHDRVTFGGTLGGVDGPEIWACSVNGLFNGGTDVQANYQAWCDAIATAFNSWFTNATNRQSSRAFLAYIKMNRIGTDGKYPPGWVTAQHTYPSPAAGAVSSPLPGFCSIVWSWLTPVQRGPASKGRIYPPNTPSSYAGGDQITGAEQSAQITAAKNMLNVLAATYSSSLAFVPTVESSIGGAFHPINGVRVGNIIDVQRRRKNQIKETYVAATWP